jgi:hypothetical protein
MFTIRIPIPELEDIRSFMRSLTPKKIVEEYPDVKNIEPEKPKDLLSYPMKVVGVSHYQDIIAKLKDNEEAKFVFEDDNPKSKNAVAVYIGNKNIGYLPDKMGEHKVSIARMIRDKINKGKYVRIDRWERVGGMYVGSYIGVVLYITNER